MTTAATLTIGDELLIGQVADTNSAALSRALGALGIRVVRMCTVGDEAADITDALAALLAQVDVVVATGGLGPTKDDKTKGVLARFFGAEKMALHEPTLRHVEALAAARGMAMNELNVAQAYVPEGCTARPNALGTAPGLWFERGAKVVVALPGVPFEAEHLMAQEVAPRLRERFATPSIVHRTALVFGVAESALAERIAGWEGALPPHLHLAYLPTPLGVKLRLSTYGAADADAAEQDMLRRFEALRQLAPEHFVGVG
ncbi:MAG: competence/damage-inducible protein A, partial [Prevotellaceae bacterium]|nr:competence/damage-inducible protein A [Prevotellaceae bacterium]